MPELAQPGDPYIDEKGRITESRHRLDVNYEINVPIAKNLLAKNPKSVREMGSDAQTQSVLNTVLVYKIVGVSNNEIAHVLGADPREIERITELPAYQETFELLFNELISAQSQSIQARIASYAGRAFDNVMELADVKPIEITAKDDLGHEFKKKHFDVAPKVILAANESILDRAGLSEEALFGKSAPSSTPDLEIVVTNADNSKTDIRIKGGR